MKTDSALLPSAACQTPEAADAFVRGLASLCPASVALLARFDGEVWHVRAACGLRPDTTAARARLLTAVLESMVTPGHDAPKALAPGAPANALGSSAVAPDEPTAFVWEWLHGPAGQVRGLLAVGASALPARFPSITTALTAFVPVAIALLDAEDAAQSSPPQPAGLARLAAAGHSLPPMTEPARYRAISDASPHGVFFADEGGTCSYMNRCARDILGFPYGDLRPRSWFDAAHPEDSPALHDEWTRTTVEHVPFDVTCRVRRDDGQVCRVHVRAQALFGADGKVEGFVGSIEDITGQERTLSRLSSSEKRLRHLYEATPALMQSIDPQGRVLAVSDAWLARFGYSRGDVIGRQAADFLTLESRASAREAAVPQLFENGECTGVEIRMLTRDGRGLDMVLSAVLERNADGSALRSLVVFEDVTQRNLAERALRHERERTQRANDRFALAARSGGIGVWEFDLHSRVFTFDEQIARLYGKPVDDLTFSLDDWLASVHPDDRDQADQALQLAIDDVCPFDTEFRVCWPDGGVHHLRAAGRLECDFNDVPVRLVGVNWDVTELRSLALELAEEHELLKVTLESIGDAVITTDRHGDITWMNPVAERMTGWVSEDAAGRALPLVFNIVHEETREQAADPVASALQQGRTTGPANRTVLISRDGTEYGIEDSTAPIRDGAGNVKGVVLVFHDVTEQRRLSGEMSYRATHDPLTELLNRSEFEARLCRLVQRSQEDASEHALLFIDLDQFKLVNDACGHAAGDLLLQQVSKLLAQSVRGRDTLARLGGDEFAVILEHCSADQAQRVAREICERVDGFRFVHGERRFRIGTSIGLVPVDARWTTMSALMQAADSACYAAKDGGRNRVHIWFDTDQAIRARSGEAQWATRLATALDEDHFELFAQRVFPLRETGARISAEVLLRLREPNGELVLPGAFLPAAERFHLIGRIDRWVLDTTLAWLGNTRRAERIENLSVNLSGQSIGDRAFHAYAMQRLREAGSVLCSKLSFEITETTAITNLADASVFIENVQQLGVRIALDDFGAGASSFTYLKSLDIDTLKIDGQFVRDIAIDPLDAAAVRCFSEVARVVGVQSVAEFVETEAALAALSALDIDFAQGFLLHRPEPIEHLDLDTPLADDRPRPALLAQ